MQLREMTFAFAMAVGIAGSSAMAVTHTLSFDTLADGVTSTTHGLVVGNQWSAAPFNLSITAVNFNRSADTAALFDANFAGSTTDGDLTGPPWTGGGNLAPSADLQRMLYIHESNTPYNEGDIIADPDDEGRRPAGKLIFNFSEPITSFGFDLVDVEGPVEIYEPNELDSNGDPLPGATPTGFFASFFANGDAVPVATVGFNELIDPLSPFYDPTISFGDNSANRVQPFTLASLGLNINGFSKVEIGLGGSAAVDNLVFDRPPPPPPGVPLPKSAWVGLVMLGALAVRELRRRRLVPAVA